MLHLFCGALARGDDPEEIIRRIADFRADDKSSPDYYARHTVMKAQAELHRTVANENDASAEVPDGIEVGRSERP